MKKYLIIIIFGFTLPIGAGAFDMDNVSGRVLLQAEANGEAWYVYPRNNKRYYLGRPGDAFVIMKSLGLGTHHELIANTQSFPEHLLGYILLDVDKNGEAYYIYPVDKKAYYLGTPEHAFELMRDMSLGISNDDLSFIILAAKETEKESEEMIKTQDVLLDVPFLTQAPFGEWEDRRQQDGCEEASAVMAMKWIQDETMDKEEGLRKILSISDYEKEKYGEYRDISLEHVVSWIFKDYFDYQNIEIMRNAEIADINEVIRQGNIILAPMNGQLLANPFFTSPGPEHHMLVIRGLSEEKNIYVTNDPGTKRGEAFNYNREILFNAIRAYPTGYHEYVGEIKKDVIVVKK